MVGMGGGIFFQVSHQNHPLHLQSYLLHLEIYLLHLQSYLLHLQSPCYPCLPRCCQLGWNEDKKGEGIEWFQVQVPHLKHQAWEHQGLHENPKNMWVGQVVLQNSWALVHLGSEDIGGHQKDTDG